MTARFTTSSGNIFTDLGFEAEEATSLKTRSDLMMEIERVIVRNKWSQTEAAGKLRVSQPRISDLKRGKISLFSIETLIDMLNRLGEHVIVQVVHDKNKSHPKNAQHAATKACVFPNDITYVTAKSFRAELRPENMWWQVNILMKTSPEQLIPAIAGKGSIKTQQIESTGAAFDGLIDKDKLHIYAKLYSTQQLQAAAKASTVR